MTVKIPTRALMAVFAILALLGQVSSRAFALDGCLPLRSTYQDEATGKKGTIEGTGCVFELPEPGKEPRYFVLTAAHVSQGENLQIGEPGNIIKRCADNRADVEIVEVRKPPVAPLGFWEKRSQAILALWKVANAWVGRDASKPRPDRSQNHINLEISRVGAFALKPDWSNGEANPYRISHWDINSLELHQHLERNLITDQLWAPAHIVPGMSGSALLNPEAGADGIYLAQRGVISQYMEDLDGSYAASGQDIARAFSRIDSCPRGALNPVKIGYRNGLTYQDYGNGTKEINPATHNAGNGSSKDGGNGSSKDGGASATRADFLKQYDLEPGILYRNQPVIGFDFGEAGVAYADRNAIQLEDLLPARLRGKQVPSRDPISGLFQKKAMASLEAWDSKARSGILSSRFVLASDTVSRGLPEGSQQILYRDGELYVHLVGPAPNHEKIDFALDEKGALRGSPDRKFQPIIVLEGAQGGSYAIDLRELFFTDLSKTREELDSRVLDGADERRPDSLRIMTKLLDQNHAGPGLIFRPIPGGRTYELRFRSVRPESEFQGNAETFFAEEPCRSFHP